MNNKRAYIRRWKAENPDKVRAQTERYRRRKGMSGEERPCLDCGNLTGRGPLAIRCLTCWRRCKKLREKYGLTTQEYDVLLASQGGLCAICRCGPSGRSPDAFHVDHDHSSGRVRGLLCSACNMGLGQFGDDPLRLRDAARYLFRARRAVPRDSSG